MSKKVEVEVSARHIHLSKNDFEFLFGPEGQYKEIKELSQSKEYATDKEVEIIGPRGKLSARFLSPFREKTQVEISATDCHQIGVFAPYEVDVSEGAAEIKIAGTAGEIKRRAAIIAKRHLHCNPGEARGIGIADGDHVTISVETKRGVIIFRSIEVKVARNYHLRLHLDTDEGNAAGISGRCFGELIIEND